MLQKKLAAVGISQKEAVAIALPNTLEFVTIFLAIAFQRAACAPLNPAYKKDEFAFYLEDLKARLVIVPNGATMENGDIIQAAKACLVAVAEICWNGHDIDFQIQDSDES